MKRITKEELQIKNCELLESLRNLRQQNEVLFAALKTITIDCKVINISTPVTLDSRVTSYNLEIAEHHCEVSATWRV